MQPLSWRKDFGLIHPEGDSKRQGDEGSIEGLGEHADVPSLEEYLGVGAHRKVDPRSATRRELGAAAAARFDAENPDTTHQIGFGFSGAELIDAVGETAGQLELATTGLKIVFAI